MGEGWDSQRNTWSRKDKPDARMKTRGTYPPSHFPGWLWDAVRDVAILLATGTWPREGGKQKQSKPFLTLVHDLSDLGFLKAANQLRL